MLSLSCDNEKANIPNKIMDHKSHYEREKRSLKHGDIFLTKWIHSANKFFFSHFSFFFLNYSFCAESQLLFLIIILIFWNIWTVFFDRREKNEQKRAAIMLPQMRKLKKFIAYFIRFAKYGNRIFVKEATFITASQRFSFLDAV